jgi:8-oxo-dGTP diphosphatase
MMTAIINACIGVIYCAKLSSVVLTCRPPGKILSGYWEFPGGKIEANETAAQALIRELKEELGIQVRLEDLQDLGQIQHKYVHGRANLSISLVTSWEDKLYPREKQRLLWVNLFNNIELTALLPTTKTVLQLARAAIANFNPHQSTKDMLK